MLQAKISQILAFMLVCVAVAAQGEQLRDPTLPSVVVGTSSAQNAAPKTQIVLQSVMRAGKGSSAVINGRIYEVGDRVLGSKIRRIDADSVTLSSGRKFKLFEAITESVGK
ncbi:MSHA biogenesis protein MshK [Shewanella gelidii]|uniref:MSHA biogenesis protein MshK n=1 Tax=Shewanella gelidii TaxID=1642821 RepID=A0A917JWU0_9GAMM|nr:MSHA biogenesis protein MshK [Shewanella gelidii]MCL1098748.1 MSHA biogenesis protein MshK [Shewanella gelidii]GGI87903.1 MSHA biogenesis protein MshK [Shewanella gelidii]